MQGGVIDNTNQAQSCCGIHGCSRATISHVAGGQAQASLIPIDNEGMLVSAMLQNPAIKASTELQNPIPSVVISPKDRKPITATFGIMCKASQGEWEYLLVEEGVILTIDNECILVRREKKTL